MSDTSDDEDILSAAAVKRRRLDKGKAKVVLADSDDDEDDNGTSAPPKPAGSGPVNGQPQVRHPAVQAVARGATESNASSPTLSTYTRTASKSANYGNGTAPTKSTSAAAAEADEDLSDEEGGRRGRNQANKWETFQRSWEAVTEDEAGGLQGAVDRLLAKARRRRAETSQASLRRSIIRHMYILFDLSSSMSEKDLRPNRFDLTLQYLRAFVTEWFDQNPLGQIGIIGLRDGLAEMIIEMGGNPHAILAALADKRKFEPSGEPSLQNGLDMARSSMGHLPSTSSLEILVLFSSLTSTDPGSIHKTLASLMSSKIRVSIIALAAELKICRLIAEKSGGKFGVALNESHYHDLIWEMVQAPATMMAGTAGLKSALDTAAKRSQGNGGAKPPPADLMMMGFPTRLPIASPLSLCACHGAMRKGGYLCPRCGAKVCEVPTDCEVCGLMVVSSPHLARSYWFLFPVPSYDTT
ncbi:hypothetical protein QFC21_002828 [Naganishia friedmannii]|uniref:Uncharacterized protein n=1 Tax=Naganishia friedmannii TaxID=89922 RepID=A0ACC2VSQ7_9TREE|nr:hypothetical protein QFC21_002828 [Naganishia friedmannii]